MHTLSIYFPAVNFPSPPTKHSVGMLTHVAAINFCQVVDSMPSQTPPRLLSVSCLLSLSLSSPFLFSSLSLGLPSSGGLSLRLGRERGKKGDGRSQEVRSGRLGVGGHLCLGDMPLLSCNVFILFSLQSSNEMTMMPIGAREATLHRRGGRNRVRVRKNVEKRTFSASSGVA